MEVYPSPDVGRRRWLQFLLGSPVLGGLSKSFAQDIPLFRPLAEIDDLDPGLPQSLEALTGVFELEKLAERVLPPAHFGYIYQGAGNGESKIANRDAYSRYDVQPRRLHGIADADMSIEMFGETWDTPLFLSPCASHRVFNPDGELASGKGASDAGITQILSSLTTTPIEEVNAVKHDKPVWFQLYPSTDETVRYEVVRRAAAAGSENIVVTVDDFGGRGSELAAPYTNRDTRDCTACHRRELGRPDFLKRKVMFMQYKDLPGFDISSSSLSFDDIRRLRDQVRGRLLVKGIMHPEDAARCLAAGADGIVVSNHGGRIDSGGVATLDVLPEIAREVKGKLKIFFDGGIRRGTDAFKALALGADAVGFGRPYLWGLAAFGAAGVTKTADLLRAELRRTMLQSGAASIADITESRLRENP
jgi:isopentenyl diphosphate isomerase/L-lactate dehydrogenase-like FMN-dependent dehydrogenase